MEELLTTSKLLEEVNKHLITSGITSDINHSKLLRWQRAGLLPEQKASGAGPGERQESYWDKSCIDRLKIIATHIKTERLNYKNAEYALIATGFVIDGNLLKIHLLEQCTEMARLLDKWERNKNQDSVDQAVSIERSTSDRMSAHGKLVKAIFTACNLGYKGLTVEAVSFQSLAHLGSYFQPHVLHDLISNSSHKQLEMAFENRNLITSTDSIVSVFGLIYGQSKELTISSWQEALFLIFPFSKGIFRRIIRILSPKPLGKLRRKKPYPYVERKICYMAQLTSALFCLVYNYHKEEIDLLMAKGINEIINSPELGLPDLIKKKIQLEPENISAYINLPSLPQ